MHKQRYTVAGSEQLESLIKQHMFEITTLVIDNLGAQKIAAIILMGGYARGEGSVLKAAGTENVFNDYDFYLIFKQGQIITKKLKQKVQDIGQTCGEKVGIEVDLLPLTLGAFKKLPFSLNSYETRYGGRILYGDNNIIQSMPEYERLQIPLREGSRLLLNRGALLGYCRRQLMLGVQISTAEREKMIKYIFKAQLALGDAYLILQREYIISYIKKQAIFQLLQDDIYPLFMELKNYYLEAIKFKLEVDYSRYSDLDLAQKYADVSRFYLEFYLWYENQRTGLPSAQPHSYKAAVKMELQRQPLQQKIRNFGINLLHQKADAIKLGLWGIGHPRERLYAALPLLLAAEWKQSPALLSELLSTHATDYVMIFDKFWATWLRYS